MRISHICSLALASLLIAPATAAQDDALETRFMMMNQHVCLPQHMGAVMELAREAMAPALAAGEEAGEIEDWGILTHGWGDEWNFNFYIVTEDHRAFLDAWSSFVGRMNEARPGWFDELAPLCTMHRDNLYTLHDLDG